MIEMKDSGIEWLGEIPSHWEVKRLKDISKLGSGTTPKSSNENYYNGHHPWLITGDVQNRLIETNENFITDLALEEIPNLKLYPAKTVLLAMYGGGTIANVGLMTYPAYINQACCAMIPNKSRIYEKFLFYYLLTKHDRIISTGVGGTQINLSQNRIAAYPIAFPSIEEQKAIADYLDKKTAEIDMQIGLLEQKTEKYINLKKSLISKVITKGLNPHIELNDSGIDWIGEIPAHWELKRMKDISELYTGKSLNDNQKELYGDLSGNDVLPYIGSKDVDATTGRINYESGYAIPMTHDSFPIAPKGSSLLCIEGGSAGKKIGQLTQSVYFVNKLCCINSRINQKYVYFFLNSTLFSNQFNKNLQGMIGGVSVALIKTFFVICPPLEEQKDIADYLELKTGEIDKQISLIDNKIKAFKNLKQSLIDEVVTGKRKIN